jgi:formylglycine-generating enzyme required for sulfatase activity
MSNSIGMTFTLIPAGKFVMGSPETEVGRRDHEGPQHEVEITRSFYLGIFPVTQAQYEKVMGRNPAHFNRSHGGGHDYPVETVTWSEAEQFCARLSLMPEEEMHGRAYRLPTEAEWEYACRAGTTTAFSCGDKLTPKEAHFAAAGVYAKTGGSGKTAPVGTLPANPWGLHDMHGNVQEWVQDWYDEYYYHDSPNQDPHGPDRGTVRVTRGGCWVMFGSDCRSATRRPHAPDSPSNAIGFRVLLIVPG